MLSAVIRSRHSYGAFRLAPELPHQRSVQLGPLVLESNPLKNQRLQQIGDQPVSRLLLSPACAGQWTILLPFLIYRLNEGSQRVVSTGM